MTLSTNPLFEHSRGLPLLHVYEEGEEEKGEKWYWKHHIMSIKCVIKIKTFPIAGIVYHYHTVKGVKVELVSGMAASSMECIRFIEQKKKVQCKIIVWMYTIDNIKDLINTIIK